jgi:uncharacterized membrane protein (UPF0127 family)
VIAPRRHLLARRAAAAALVALMAVAGCSDDDESGTDPPAGTEAPESPAPPDGAGTTEGSASGTGAPAEPVSLADLAAASGDAPAAGGADLDEPPGPADRSAVPGVGEVAASITAADGTVTGCCLMVAATDEQRQRGLMEVTDLGGYQGMVFVWDRDTEGAFWMRNTPTPLSIAWFDADGEFVSATDMAPCSATADDCPMYPPDGPYRFAVEVFEGELDALGVGPGSRLAMGGDCAAATASG